MKKIKNYLEDLFIFTGLIFINIASYLKSVVLGLYITGFTLLILGIFFAFKPLKGGD